jgi:uncharacterized protein (DUF1800 family)
VRRTLVLLPLVVASLVAVGVDGLADGSRTNGSRLPGSGLTEDARVVHALNRLGFGPRPGDVGRVRQAGLDRWMAAQLSPEGIADPVVDGRLREFATLGMDATELLVEYPPPQLVQGLERALTRRIGMEPEAIRGMFPELARFDPRNDPDAPERPEMAPGERMRRMLDGPARITLDLSQAKLVRAVHGKRQLQEVMTDFWFNHFNVFVGKGADRWWASSYERDAIRPHALGKFRDLLGATARHPAMLIYLDTWLSAAEGADYDRALGERYAAVANREAGLPPGGVATLLLRDRGMDTRAVERGIERRQQRPGSRNARPDESQRRPRGLNENYARELLELHTLGVDGGYTQQDIVEVARCFTGWTLLPVQAGQQFVFMSELHDRGKKTVLGHTIRSSGIAEGERVLDILAKHPSTARFISTKLARRFVSDEPPAALVDRMARRFTETGGDIREVLVALFESEEFWAPEVVGGKVKTPFEYVASMLRASNAEILSLPGSGSDRSSRPGLLGALRQLGQPLYAAQAPTGYDDTAEAWVSTGALLQRMKVAVAVAVDHLPGVEVPPPEGESIASIGRQVLGREPTESTFESVRRQLGLPAEDLQEVGLPRRMAKVPGITERLTMAWLLASPEFQRR